MANTITDKGTAVALFYHPKTGVCNLCRAVEGEVDTQRDRFYLRTHHIHHDEYDDKDVTAHTIELCPACHNSEHLTWLIELGEYVQPFLLLGLGALITSYLGPRITRQWQDNKTKNEIRIKMTQEMSETVAYGTGKILTAIGRFRDIHREGGKLAFTPDEAAQQYEEFENWHVKTYAIGARLRSYFYPNTRINLQTDVDILWHKYTDTLLVVWQLATKLYFSGATPDQIAIFLRNYEDELRKRFRQIDWEKIKNRDINELANLSTSLLGYGYAVISAIDFSKIKISEKGSIISSPSWFRFRLPRRQRGEQQQEGQQQQSQSPPQQPQQQRDGENDSGSR